jgi:NLR family CARD domain-containing protein 3|eukprot:5892514-Prymnesium_polylepis.2
MYCKYNTAIRGVADETNGPLAQNFKKLCRSNAYTTTLHTINSATVKLSNLTKVGKVYRGISGYLPDSFWNPNEWGSVGGVEMAFMSTSVDRQTARDYAGREHAVILEMDMGMLGRGADIAWLSMYPDEKEILFPPLTALEVERTTVEGPAFVVTCRPTVNRYNRPIEQV